MRVQDVLIALLALVWSDSHAVDPGRLKKEPRVFQEALFSSETADLFVNTNGLRRAISKGFNLDTRDSGGLTLLAYAISDGNAEAIALLLRAKASTKLRFTDDGVGSVSVAHMAAANGCSRCLGLLLVADPTLIDAADANGDTPIFRAVRGEQSSQVSLLWAVGANVLHKNRQGLTVFDLQDPRNAKMSDVLLGIKAPD